MNNIQYDRSNSTESEKSSIEIRVWQSYKIGNGKPYEWCTLESVVSMISHLNIISSKNVPSPWTIDAYEISGIL